MKKMSVIGSNSMPEEHPIGSSDLHQLDAEYITSEILTHLSDAGYSADNILSQFYDGASVMRGVRGGVQALLQKKLVRYVPNIHCYNHQLHLGVVHAMCPRNMVHPILKGCLKTDGQAKSEVTRCSVENQDHIFSNLSEMTEDDDAVDLCAEASGLQCQIKRHHFFETGKFLVQVLNVLKPANAIIQSHTLPG